MGLKSGFQQYDTKQSRHAGQIPAFGVQVFERLGLSLYDFLRKNSYKPFHLDIVRAFGRQLLEAVAYLHDLALIHTDLKPENILLQSSEYDKQTPPPGSRCALILQPS